MTTIVLSNVRLCVSRACDAHASVCVCVCVCVYVCVRVCTCVYVCACMPICIAYLLAFLVILYSRYIIFNQTFTKIKSSPGVECVDTR